MGVVLVVADMLEEGEGRFVGGVLLKEDTVGEDESFRCCAEGILKTCRLESDRKTGRYMTAVERVCVELKQYTKWGRGC